MEELSSSDIDRQDPSSKSGGSLLSRYVKSPSVQLEKLSQSSFNIKELIDFYDGRQEKTTLPEEPRTAKDVSDMFRRIQSQWEKEKAAWYGVIDHNNRGEYVGDVMVEPIKWNESQASIKFYIPERDNCVPDVIKSLSFVLANDLGLDLIRVHATDDIADKTNDAIESLNGQYEGEQRSYRDDEDFRLIHTWSVTGPEILDDKRSIETQLSYGDSEEE